MRGFYIHILIEQKPKTIAYSNSYVWIISCLGSSKSNIGPSIPYVEHTIFNVWPNVYYVRLTSISYVTLVISYGGLSLMYDLFYPITGIVMVLHKHCINIVIK